MLTWLKNASSAKIALIIFSIGFALYFFSIFNSFVADDNVYILENPQIRNFDLSSFFSGSSYYTGDVTQLSGIYYKPIFTLITSFLFNLSAQTPYLIRFVQILIHLTNAFLLFLFFRHFFSKNIAFILALIFLVHPGNTESVVYIADLQDVLFFLFGIFALLISLKEKLSNKSLIAIGSFLLLSLLSKESGVLFLPTIVLLSFTKNRKYLLQIILVASSVFLIYLFMRFGIAQVTINHQSISPIMDASLPVRLMTIPKIIYSYLVLFVFPKDLSWAQHWVVITPDFPNFLLPLLFIFVFLLMCIYFFYKTPKKQKGDFIFFFLTLLFGFALHAQIIPLDFTFAERWFYFPLFALLGLTAYFFQTKRFSKYLLILIIIIIPILATRTFIRTLNWRDDFTLSSHDLTVDNSSFALENNLGFELIKRSDYQNAQVHLENSIRLYPARSNVSAYNNLAYTYAKLNQRDKSLNTYQSALDLGDYYITYQNYIAELIRQDKNTEAENLLNKALQRFPNNPKLYLLLAVNEYHQKNIDKAVLAAQKANYLTPGIANLILSKIQKNEPINL